MGMMKDFEDPEEEERPDNSDESGESEENMLGGTGKGPSTHELWVQGSGPDCIGTTAVVALVRYGSDAEILVANAGDSRCTLLSGSKAKDLSRDHKPGLASESARIKNAGGFITDLGSVGGRVDGN